MAEDIKKLKEILTTGDATEGSLLIPRKIADLLVEEVEKALLPRELARMVHGPSNIPGSSIDVDLVTKESSVVFRLGEGAAIPLTNPTYESVNIKPVKYGTRILITREMMEDAKWNLLDHAVRMAGKRIAENETSLILTALDGATNVVSGGAAITVANITQAMNYLITNDYKPTDFIIGADVLMDLQNIDTFVEFQKAGNTDMLTRGFLGNIYGMRVHLFSSQVGTATRAYVIDKDNAYDIAEKRPVSVERYDEPGNDMSGAIVTQRIAVARIRDAAICRVTTS